MSKKNNESGLTFEAKCWRVFEDKDSSMLGSFSVTVNGSLVIRDILLIKGKKGKSNFVSMPSRSYKDGKKTMYVDICYLLNKEDSKALREAVEEAYNEFEEDDD